MEETPKTPKRGRKAIRSKGFRLTDVDIERLASLAEAWECSEADVLRRLMREAVEAGALRTRQKPEGSLRTALLATAA